VRGVNRLNRGRIDSVKAREGVRLTRRCSARVGARGIRLGTCATAQSVGPVNWLVGLGDGTMGSSPRVMNSVYIYKCILQLFCGAK
jgi:hypothetical protein